MLVTGHPPSVDGIVTEPVVELGMAEELPFPIVASPFDTV